MRWDDRKDESGEHKWRHTIEVMIIRKMEGKKELVAEREAGIDKYGEALLMTD